MKKFLFSWFKKPSKSDDTRKLVASVTPEAISSAYKARYKEIESLRKYDRGEKDIIAPNLRDIVRGV